MIPASSLRSVRLPSLVAAIACLTWFGGLAGCAATTVAEPRLCLSPDCLQVDNVHSKKGAVKSIGILDTSLRLYIWVPPATTSFALGVFDQNDDGPAGKPSQFTLISPDGKNATLLDNPLPAAWTNYPVQTAGQWGIWCLNVRGPEDTGANNEDGAPAKKGRAPRAVNLFMVRTSGDVDLYLHPDAVARVRGLRLAGAHFGGENTHHFYVGAPGAPSLRFSWLHAATAASVPKAAGQEGEGPALRLAWPGSATSRQPLDGDDRLTPGLSFETVAFQEGKPLAPDQLLLLTVQPGGEGYGLGVEQSARLFFNPRPLFPAPRPVRVQVACGNQPLAARVTATSERTLNEPATFYTASNGEAIFWALPGVSYHLLASGGPGFVSGLAELSAEPAVSISLKPALQPLPGWYAGDTHCHTWLYDGSDSPAGMVEAARAAGLDWLVISEHAHSPFLERAQRASLEATRATAGQPGLVVIPGLEYTGPRFHANVLGAAVAIPSGASLAEVIDRAEAASSDASPVAVQVNHPSLGATAAGIARDTPGLPMMELWNSPEPAATSLWFDLLNSGARVLADTGSDSHNRQNLLPGTRRLFVYLGADPPTTRSVILALKAGRSFLSRGAIVDFTLENERPGATVLATAANQNAHVSVQSPGALRAVELVQNGRVLFSRDAGGKTAWQGDFVVPPTPGWCLVRAFAPGDDIPVCMTNPIWFGPQLPGAPPATPSPN